MILHTSQVMRPQPLISTVVTFTAPCPVCRLVCDWTQHMGEKPQPLCRCA